MNLFDINEKIERLLNDELIIDENTGEVLATYDDLENLLMAFDEKIDNVAYYIKSLDCLTDGLDKEIKVLQTRKKQAQAKTLWLKNYLTTALKMRNMSKFESTKNKITFRKSESVEIIDESKIDIGFLRVKFEPDKTKIKESLKKGKNVEGCELVTKSNIQIKRF